MNKEVRYIIFEKTQHPISNRILEDYLKYSGKPQFYNPLLAVLGIWLSSETLLLHKLLEICVVSIQFLKFVQCLEHITTRTSPQKKLRFMNFLKQIFKSKFLCHTRSADPEIDRLTIDVIRQTQDWKMGFYARLNHVYACSVASVVASNCNASYWQSCFSL